jgi:hypothetical protein
LGLLPGHVSSKDQNGVRSGGEAVAAGIDPPSPARIAVVSGRLQMSAGSANSSRNAWKREEPRENGPLLTAAVAKGGRSRRDDGLTASAAVTRRALARNSPNCVSRGISGRLLRRFYRVSEASWRVWRCTVVNWLARRAGRRTPRRIDLERDHNSVCGRRITLGARPG